MKHLLITLAVVVLTAGLLTACSSGSSDQTLTDISVKTAYDMVNANRTNSNFVLLDIRTPQEFNEGHLTGAVNIDFYAPNFSTELSKLDKNKVYVIYCRTGNRTGQSMRIFKKLGFKEVHNVLGGISEWRMRNLPL